MKITREVKIGLFAVICLAVLFWGVNFLKGKNVFSRTNHYYAVFKRVDGLKPTNDVLLSGFKVGLVKDIKFEKGNTGRLIVTILIEKKYPIPRNSILKLISADIMGGKALRLDVTPNNEFHEAGDTLIASIETGLLDQMIFEMVPIKEKAESLMEGLETTLDIIAKVFNEQNRDNLNKSFESLKNSLDNVDNLSGQLNGMLSDENGKLLQIVSNVHQISQNLKNNGKDFDIIIKNFSSISDTLAKANLARTLAQTDSAMLAFNAIVSKINNGEGSMGMLINNDTLYTNLQKASHNLDLLLYDMKVNPKRYINISLFDFSRTKYQKEKK
ncbi:MAG: MlaD family protein [Tenuifilaceae bacterium]|jgi:phospholipid/cholesterol/gamma-HCH transport system substrate-binding protein|nr:MlaD family protein [Tenuifilaceae bacterium]